MTIPHKQYAYSFKNMDCEVQMFSYLMVVIKHVCKHYKILKDMKIKLNISERVFLTVKVRFSDYAGVLEKI